MLFVIGILNITILSQHVFFLINYLFRAEKFMKVPVVAIMMSQWMMLKKSFQTCRIHHLRKVGSLDI